MGLGDLLGQATKLKQKIATVQEELEKQEVEGTAGGGMVKVVANGKQEFLRLSIDPQVVDPEDITMLEDLVLAAINEARRKSHELMMAEFSKITGGLPIPGIM